MKKSSPSEYSLRVTENISLSVEKIHLVDIRWLRAMKYLVPVIRKHPSVGLYIKSTNWIREIERFLHVNMLGEATDQRVLHAFSSLLEPVIGNLDED